MFDRFRSRPIWRAALIVGALLPVAGIRVRDRAVERRHQSPAIRGLGLLEEHMGSCVVDAARAGGHEADAKVKEASDAIARLVRS